MKKKKNIIIILLILFVIGVSVFFLSKKPLMNKFEFSKCIIVKNNTNHNNVDTIAMVILTRLMKIDTININIFNIREGMFNDGNINIIAYIEKAPYNTHQYTLFLAKNFGNYNVNDVILHEMVHVEQMESGDLIQSVYNKIFAIYKNDTIYYAKISYEIRPFEIDAVNKQTALSNALNKLLYK